MLSENDLQVAMERGIITRQQMDQLERFAAERDKELKQTVRDEAPRFVRSFGDLFVAIGVVFLVCGLMFATSAISGESKMGALLFLAMPVILWGFAEWITAKLRMSAPSIVLAIAFNGFVFFSALSLIKAFQFDAVNAGSDNDVLLATLVSFVANLAYYWRFRLPFCLLIFGGLFCYLTANLVDTEGLQRWVLLASALALFALAMWFDLQDPTRSTRSSDAAFWLHLVSAPIIVHSALFGTIPFGKFDSAFGTAADYSPELILLAALLLILFAVTAILIDRRAFLVSSLSYTGGVFGYAIWSFNLSEEIGFSVTLILLAILVLVLGTAWRQIRAFVFRFLPQTGLVRYLPPVDA